MSVMLQIPIIAIENLLINNIKIVRFIVFARYLSFEANTWM